MDHVVAAPIQRIEELDHQLTALFRGFDAISNELVVPVICELSDERAVGEQRYPGIYRIDVDTAGPHNDFESWVAAFQADWEHADFRREFTPNTKKKRIRCHASFDEWLPIYLGKSREVAARVLQHINLDLGRTTFALKLKARANMANRRFRLSALRLPVHNYDLIAPALEDALRDRFNPILGK